MSESIAGQAQNAITALKNNTSGNLQIKNGRIYNTGNNSYTTVGGDAGAPTGEAVEALDSQSLKRAKNFTGTGDLTISNGNIRVTGHGQITLVD